MVMKVGCQAGGMASWMVVRISAVCMLVYFFWLLLFFFFPHQHQDWGLYLRSTSMRISGGLAVFGVVIHAWIGVWTVLTDYIHIKWLRTVLEMCVGALLLGCFIWGMILMGG